MLIKLVSATTLALALVGCAVNNPAIPSESAHYGAYPQTSNEFGADVFLTILKDPDGAFYRFSKPRKAYLTNNRGDVVAWTGYAIPVAVNGKNSYGGYQGYKPYLVLINDGVVKTVFEGAGHRNLRYMSPIPTEELEQAQP